ncbi:MAG: hypothetical protein NTZ65_03215 [Candidatus Berkelbacteria bacterium]|nr:hypothetical protein [Candidatus Berkelbacteria bacterium]
MSNIRGTCPSDHCRKHLDNVVLISGGNELTHGNVQIYVRQNGKDLTLPLDNKYHDEIKNPDDHNPADAGCEELVQSEPQLIITNNFVATMMLCLFYSVVICGNDPGDEIYCDVLTCNARAETQR